MSQLQNAKHEVFARKIARDTVDPTRIVNQSHVYSELYPASNAPQNSASALMRRPEIQERIFQLINKDVPFENLSKTLKRHLKAKREVWIAKRDDNGLILRDDKGIELKSKRSIHQWDVQGKALEIGMKVYRVIGSGTNESGVIDNRQINFHFNQEKSEQLLRVAEQLKRLNESLQLNQSYGTVIPPKQEATD